MLENANLPMMVMVNDIESLIAEIDNNPQLSSWVVRLILKSMKEKAKKLASEIPPGQVSLEEVAHLEA